MITQEELKELLEYQRDTGVFIWRIASGARAKAGATAGAFDTYGYRQIQIKKRLYLAHRLAWLYEFGYWPEKTIDHINGIKDDNRIDNLREVSMQQNKQNLKGATKSNKTTGILGVYAVPSKRNPYAAQIGLNKKKIHLGRFPTLELAKEARAKAERELYNYKGK